MSLRRLVAALALGMAAGPFLLPPAASAGALSPLHVSKTTLSPNESFTVSGTGCVSPDADFARTGQVWVQGPAGGQTDPDSAGTWSITMREGATFNGTYPLQATCSYQTATSTSVTQDYAPVSITVVGGQVPYPTSVPHHADVPTPQPSRSGQGAAPRISAHPPAPAVPAAPAAVSPAGSPTVPPPVPGPAAASPAPGCIFCARIASGAPLGAGWPVTLRYAGFQPNEQVALVMHSTPVRLGTFPADASGTVVASVRIPVTAEGGSHTFVFSGPASGERSVSFSVTAAAPAEVAPPSPAGSRMPLRLAAAGTVVALGLIGGVAVVVLRRRRRHDRTAVAAP